MPDPLRRCARAKLDTGAVDVTAELRNALVLLEFGQQIALASEMFVVESAFVAAGDVGHERNPVC